MMPYGKIKTGDSEDTISCRIQSVLATGPFVLLCEPMPLPLTLSLFPAVAVRLHCSPPCPAQTAILFSTSFSF